MRYQERHRLGRCPHPSAGILDSQSVKVSDQGRLSGYDGYKKIKGCKRHSLVDTFGNLLEVVGTADDITVGNGGGTFDTSQNVEADLSVSKAGNFQVGEVGLVGDTITWTITVANTGTASANGVQITDNVPGELRVDDALADLGTVTVQGQRVTFTVESLGVGQSAQFSVVTTILAQPSSGLFNNSVNVLLPDGEGSGSDANLVASSSVSSVDGLPATGVPLVISCKIG